MEKQWSYFVNPFDTSTKDSYLKALNLSTFHFNALASMQTDPYFGPLYTAYTPIHNAYKNAYVNWTNQTSTQTSKTLSLEQFIKLLSNTKARQWDVAVQAVHVQGTPAYKAVLPHFRVPFQSGTQAERINAVKSFSLALTGDVALATTKTDVDNFYSQLDLANNTQKTSKTSTTTHSEAVETARINLCNAMYANLGSMINKYAATPDVIAPYFDLATIRTGSQVHFTGHVKPQHIHAILTHTFGTADQLKLENKGTTDLQFYLAQTKDAKPYTAGIILHPTEQQTVLASALGNITNTHLIVYNPHAVEKGEFVVELV